jgi:hypothetical protein
MTWRFRPYSRHGLGEGAGAKLLAGLRGVWFELVELFDELVHALGQGLDFGFGADVDLVVEFAADAVFGVLAVLAHHDDGGLDAGEHGEEEIEQDEGVGIPGAVLEGDVDPGVGDEDEAEEDDEGPGAAEAGYGVGEALAEGGFFFDDFVGVAGDAGLDEFLGGVELAGLHGEHVEAGLGFALEQAGDVVAADFEARGVLDGDGGGVVFGLLEHGGESEEVAVFGLVDYHLLLVVVDGGEAGFAGADDVAVGGRFAGFVDVLAGREVSDLDLRGEHPRLFVIEQFKEGNVTQFFRIAWHRTSLLVRNGDTLGGKITELLPGRNRRMLIL